MASGFPRTFSRFQELRQPSVGGSKRWQPRVVIKLVGVRTLRWHRVNPSRERGVLGRSLPIGGEQKREVGALPKTFAFPAINEMAGATHPGELSRLRNLSDTCATGAAPHNGRLRVQLPGSRMLEARSIRAQRQVLGSTKCSSASSFNKHLHCIGFARPAYLFHRFYCTHPKVG